MPVPLRLLIVEDSEDDARLLVREFVRGGHEPVWERVESEPEMRASLEQREWDLIVSDYSLPRFSAPAALAVMKGMGLDLPFLVVSGVAGEETAVEMMKAGAHDFLLKGHFARLIPAVKRELGQAAQRSASRRAEEKHAQFAAIVEFSADAIIGKTLDGIVTAWNAGAERLYGYSAEEAIGRPIGLHVPANRAGEIMGILERIRCGENIDHFETVRLRKDGTRIDVSLTVSPIRNSSGEVIGASAITRDITQRKRAEESIQKLLRAVEQAKNVIFMTDPNGAITYVNPAFEETYGYSKEEALGKTPRILKSGQRDQASYERFWQRLLAGESVREEFVNKTREGELVTVENSVSPVLDGQGRRIGFIAVQDDVTERKRTEEALRNSERLFSVAFQASPIPTSIVEMETGRMLDVNEQLSRILGYSREELLGRNAVELELWVDQADRDRRVRKVLTEGAVRDEEIQIRTRSGEIRDVTGSAVRVDVGGISCVLSTFLDITERKRAEKELRRSEERFRRLFDSNTIGITVADLSGQILESNDAYLAMVGYTREELLSGVVRWDEMTPAEYREKDQIAVEQLQRTGVAQPYEKALIRKNGTRVSLLIGIAMLEASERSIIAYTVDLSERRQAEEALRASEERYRLLFESNPQPMWVFDEKTLAFLAVNEAACRHYGYSREEFLGMTIEDVRPAEDVPALRRLLETGSREHQESGVWRHRKKDGTLIDVEISSNPLVLDGRRARLVLATDVTERRQLEEQLRLSQKMEAIGQLAGGIAHDFNNLLTAILGYAALLETEVGKGSPLSESIGEIRKAGERAASLTRQLLAFSRRQVLEPKVLDLNALAENIEKMLRRLIGEDVELVTVLDPGIGRVRADAGQLEQVVMNLAVNARDAMPKGGTLTIETKDVELDEAYAREHISVRPGRYVMLAVSDTGLGMSGETKSHMFEPFFTTKGKGKGTGLGLATVYGIVKQSGGYVWVYSELNRGTSFKVYLPRVEGAVDAAPTRRVPQRQTGGSETLLLVEDEQAVRVLVRRILESYGYTVIEANGAAQALEAVRRWEGPIHLVLTDVIMPEMGGSELTPRVAELRPDVRVLFMSGYSDDAVVRQGLIAEGGHFLQKPFTPDALARKVREILDHEP